MILIFKHPRSTTQLLTINFQSNSTTNNPLPKLLPLSTQRTIVDMNIQDQIAFIIDITTLNNHTYQPIIYLNNTNLFSCWNISSTGEVRLISHPFASSYILSLNIIDQYNNEYSSIKLQIDLCNSSILNSCQTFSFSDNRQIFIYAIGLALIITLICIIIFSIIICLCCRKSKPKKDLLSSTHQHSFLQCNDEYQVIDIKVHQIQQFEMMIVCFSFFDFFYSSSFCLGDSACIINGNSSSTSSSSSGIVIKNDTWHNRKESTIQMYPTSAAYYYDLKLAEFLRKNQHPLCVHLNDLPPIPQSYSTDYGFSSLELSESSSISTLPNQHVEICVDQSSDRQLNMKSFISSRECVV